MSTHAVIARETGPQQFSGRYHHLNGFIKGLGSHLWNLHNGLEFKDFDELQQVLIDKHPAGWLTLAGDWTRTPGFGSEEGPQCYCHGERHEGHMTITQNNAARMGCIYAYVFHRSDQGVPYMRIYAIVNEQAEAKGRGGKRAHKPPLEEVADINLEGRRPNWSKLEDKVMARYAQNWFGPQSERADEPLWDHERPPRRGRA